MFIHITRSKIHCVSASRDSIPIFSRDNAKGRAAFTKHLSQVAGQGLRFLMCSEVTTAFMYGGKLEVPKHARPTTRYKLISKVRCHKPLMDILRWDAVKLLGEEGCAKGD